MGGPAEVVEMTFPVAGQHEIARTIIVFPVHPRDRHKMEELRFAEGIDVFPIGQRVMHMASQEWITVERIYEQSSGQRQVI
jgi:hypothetical protein